jgi:uncharacterized protein (TIGR02996 family)
LKLLYTRGEAFVELTLEGLDIVSRFGQLGDRGRKAIRGHQTAEEAHQQLRRHVRRLMRHGYLPGRRHTALEAAIRAAPHDLEHRRVYADWLSDCADPRGDLILAHLCDDEVAAQSLLDEHPWQLLPGRLDLLERPEVVWFGGFAASIVYRFADSRGWIPGDEGQGAVVRDLLRHPSCHFLERLVVVMPASNLSREHVRLVCEAIPSTLMSLTYFVGSADEDAAFRELLPRHVVLSVETRE